ncbi:MAG: hypothetical protein HFI90_02825 [Clostridia bacterium]|nr:hypothetical protein [Clostridia bacterium]
MKKRSISLLLSLVMMVSVIGSMIPVMAEEGGSEESQWTQVLNMQLGSGESEYTVTQAGNANLEITSTTENYLQVKAKADGNYSAAGDQLKFEVPLKKDGQDFIMDSAKKYYFEVTVVDGMKTVAGKNAQLFASCAGKKANGTENGTHSAFVFNSNSSKFNINKGNAANNGADYANDLGSHTKGQPYAFGYILDTSTGAFSVYEGTSNQTKLGGPYNPSWGGVDIRTLKCEFKNYLSQDDYVQLRSIKVYEWNGTEDPTTPPDTSVDPVPSTSPTTSPSSSPTTSPTVSPSASPSASPSPSPVEPTLIFSETYENTVIDTETNMAEGWIVSSETETMTKHTIEDGALKMTKTVANSSDNAEKITMNHPLKIYAVPYDAATRSAIYTDELFGKYQLELEVKPHVTTQLAAVGFSKKAGGSLAKGAGVSLTTSNANVWIATGDTRVVQSNGSPNDRKNKIIYTLDTNNTGAWTINFEGQEARTMDQNWGGLAGIYLGLKPSNNKDDSIAIYSSKIYETENYKQAETAALAAIFENLTIDKLTDTPDAVVEDLKSLPSSVGGKALTWTTSNAAAISATGAVTRPIGDDVDVVLTAKMSDSGIDMYKEFHLTVGAITDPLQILEAAAEKLTMADLTDEDPDEITANLKSLPQTGAFGTTITWTSSDTTVMNNDGTIVKLGDNAKLPVTMTATFSFGGKTLQKTFDLKMGVNFMNGLYTLYETDFSGSDIAANIEQVPGVGKIKQEGGKLLLDRTGTSGGTGTTVRIYPALGDEKLKITGEMIVEADVHLPAACEKVEIIPYDDAGNRIFTIYSGKAGGGHGYTYVCRPTLSESPTHPRVDVATADLTLKIKARFNLKTKRLTLEVADDGTENYKTLVSNKFIREEATNLSYIEINGVDNSVEGKKYNNTGIVEINKVKVIVNKGYVPQYIVDNVDYYSAITKLKGFVSGDIALNTKALPGTKVTWTSSKPEVVGNDGKLGTITEDVDGIVMTFRLEMLDDPQNYIEKVFDPLKAVHIPEGNLALNQKASSNVGSKKGSGPESAVDGNVGTNWETAKWTNTEDPALTIDFGQVQVFNQIMLKEAMILDTYPLRKFVLESSVDGKNYTQLATGGTLGEALQFISVNQTLARYLRFRVTEKVATSNVGLAEIQVFLTGGEETKVTADLLALKYQLGSLMGLTANVDLPQTGALYGSKFVYASSDTSALMNDGTVVRPSTTKSGTLRVEAFAKTGDTYSPTKGGEDSYPFSVQGLGGGNGGTPVGNRPSGGSGGGGGGIGAALPTTPSVNSPVGNETGSQTTGSFRDVPRDYWGYNYIETLKSHQIVNGDENGNFNPEAQITREEFLKMLMNALGIAINDIKDVNLTDVSGSDWCYPYIAKAMELGIVSGTTETTFGTGSNITREDMAVMSTRALAAVKRTLTQMENEKTFTDDGQISGYAQDSVQQMQQAGIIGGYADGSFGPQQNATRAEAAKIICGMMN